jgi:asparagine synthase (glutamine-hydrolysing)
LGARWQSFQPHGNLRSLRPHTLQTLWSARWTRQFEREHHGVTGIPVQFRHPFFDLGLIEFLWSIPPIPHFFNKDLLRATMLGRLPESVRLRPKNPLPGDHIRAKYEQKWADWREFGEERELLRPYVNFDRWPQIPDAMRSWHYPMHLRPLSLLCWLNVHNLPA